MQQRVFVRGITHSSSLDDAMVAEAAQLRLERALASKTRLAIEQLELNQGDLVDFYRPPATKDESGWRGPAEVVEAPGPPIVIRWQGRHLQVRTQDLRRALVYFVYPLLAFENDDPQRTNATAVSSPTCGPGRSGCSGDTSGPDPLAMTTCGTPYYMSPERFCCASYAKEADLCGVGCVLWELITLRRPFDGAHLGALVRVAQPLGEQHVPLGRGLRRVRRLARRPLEQL